MAKEIEMKYLLYENGLKFTTDGFDKMFGDRSGLEERVQTEGTFISQAYLEIEEGKQLAADIGMNIDFDATTYRIRQKGDHYFFTVKGFGHVEKIEEEVGISGEIFDKYFGQTKAKIAKFRLTVPYHGKQIEIDFFPPLELITAEIEGTSQEDLQAIPAPGKDISTEARYKNQVLAGQYIKR